ncbi:Swi5-domain-containing protein [Calocera cornea HHB12733]|uniref:Swi5-domain-containing protein n=1 Tax=Calocera cornea HHB12733 TaxID=1353952 RepID=A0A165JLT8_9BASI|nr:Swi5-domain-containing protein [Calocera cornea HHB12733]
MVVQPKPKSLTKEEEDALRKEIAELEKELNGKDPNEAVKEHIRILHEYNELKDATQLMIGRLANMKDITIRQTHEDYGLTSDD